MRESMMYIILTLGLGLLIYVATDWVSMTAGQSVALEQAEQAVNDTVIKQGGGTEPISIANGEAPLVTALGTQSHEQRVASTTQRTTDAATPSQSEQETLQQPQQLSGQQITETATESSVAAVNGPSVARQTVSTAAPFQVADVPTNVLNRYAQAAQDVDFQALQNQAYGAYQVGQAIGVLYIPRLDRSIPIIYGTDENELRYGVGFYRSTKLPGQNDQILLAGHRDTVFRSFDQLQIGDEFHVKMANGTYIYTIFGSQIVDAYDTTVIQSTYPNEILTVSTCYPFNYFGEATHRYILYAR